MTACRHVDDGATSTNVNQLWGDSGVKLVRRRQAPAIAIVDSGIDASKASDFGGRVVARANFSSIEPNSTGDPSGHGTMVAGIAAGGSSSYPGVAKNAPLVDVRVASRLGEAKTSDIVSAVDWMIANKSRYNIRVANFSLAGTSEASFRFDPLNKAVEKLWISGVVVVAAVGNNGSATGPGEDRSARQRPVHHHRRCARHWKARSAVVTTSVPRGPRTGRRRTAS